MNVTELVRKLKMTKEEFFPLTKELGFDIGEHAIKVNDSVAQKIIEAIRQKRKTGRKKSIFGEEAVEPKKVLADDAQIVQLPDSLTVKAFSEKIGKPVTDVIAVLMQNGIMATINENIDFETATIIAEDLGFKTEHVVINEEQAQQVSAADLLASILEKDTNKKQTRPPVVVVMGHVDHGKTKLLDAIRKTNIVDQEAGGITQHIGAYQVEKKGRQITLIDTPGHEAFSAMRSRGANVADIAILVIAADDGIKPQTVEAIEIMEKAHLPFVVAINKIDKPGADIERVKKDLAQYNLIPEDWGGKTICVPISAKQLQGIDDLLEMVLLVADLEKDAIIANPDRDAAGTIIESHVDKGKGAVATVLIQTGTLYVGDNVIVGNTYGKVKAMANWNGKLMKSVGPSQPAQILGLKSTPTVGDILQVAENKKVFKQKTKEYKKFSTQMHRDESKESEATIKRLSIVLRADTLGSLEALIESLEKITHKDVKIDIISSGLGSITEKDIVLAESSHAIIFGFSVALTPGAEQASHRTQVSIKTYSIIYELLEEATKQLEALLDPETIFNLTGKIKLLATFKTSPSYKIVGGKVIDGFIQNQSPTKIFRNGKKVGEGMITQLQCEKKNVSKATNGSECGIRIDTETLLEVGDELEVYVTEQKARLLNSI